MDGATAGGAAEESTVVGMVMQKPVHAAERKSSKRKVMVAVDESEGSFYALRWTLDHLVRRSSPAPAADEEEEVEMITLVHVQQPFQHYPIPAGPGGTAFYATPSVVESARKAQEENSALILSRALHMCKESMVKAETLILIGDPKDTICQATEQMHMDLLVVGSRGLGKIKRAFLGSVSDYCAHHAKCPILIVRSPKEASKQ
ncbi:universal stress protein A-like protein [Syzygium oleosum]|uniref:universal stress protein A-like protein n=1 Tax=Syzygium oleosum TaxID=219896 RepID=UPI0024BAAF6E|nr:universal stress protein A-like protein [Syzygium oleosum]